MSEKSLDNIVALAGLSSLPRRVQTAAGAIRFNKAIGQIINEDVKSTSEADRAATLSRLLTLYNRMRAAKLYGQEEMFKTASAEMSDAVENYGNRFPGSADKIRDIVKNLSFADEKEKRANALKKKNTTA